MTRSPSLPPPPPNFLITFILFTPYYPFLDPYGSADPSLGATAADDGYDTSSLSAAFSIPSQVSWLHFLMLFGRLNKRVFSWPPFLFFCLEFPSECQDLKPVSSHVISKEFWLSLPCTFNEFFYALQPLWELLVKWFKSAKKNTLCFSTLSFRTGLFH